MRSISALAALLLGMTLSAVGQINPTAHVTGGDVALTYQYLHSNTQPGACGCFNLNGGGFSASWLLRPRWSMVTEADAGFANNGPGTGNSITLISGVAGIRYGLPVHLHSDRAPSFFAELLAGIGHAGGGIAGAGDGNDGFVGHVGGGMDQPLSRHFALRFSADYVPTTFANGVNGRQNNLLAAAGFVYRWSRQR